MNERSEPAADPRLQRYLDDLPLAVPPAALERRLFERLGRRRDRRRLLLAVAALLVIGLVPRLLAPGLPATTAAPDPASAELLRAEVRALDRELQAAYAGGEHRRLDSLWLAREAAARRLADPSAAAAQPVRL